MNQSAENSNPPKTFELEIKDAQVIFDTVWESLEEEVGHQNLRFPKELILLGGAPGSGKGTHTRFIMRSRGLTCPPIIISQLLTTPEATRIKDMGQMVGDTEVIGILFRELLKENTETVLCSTAFLGRGFRSSALRCWSIKSIN